MSYVQSPSREHGSLPSLPFFTHSQCRRCFWNLHNSRRCFWNLHKSRLCFLSPHQLEKEDHIVWYRTTFNCLLANIDEASTWQQERRKATREGSVICCGSVCLMPTSEITSPENLVWYFQLILSFIQTILKLCVINPSLAF